jgi:hypothetical protein
MILARSSDPHAPTNVPTDVAVTSSAAILVRTT